LSVDGYEALVGRESLSRKLLPPNNGCKATVGKTKFELAAIPNSPPYNVYNDLSVGR